MTNPHILTIFFKEEKMKKRFGGFSMIIALFLLVMVPMGLTVEPGEAPDDKKPSSITPQSIEPIITERGEISLSIDGLGTLYETGIIQVEKPAGATVRRAFMAAASTGFNGYTIPDGDIMINGVGVNWDIVIPNSIQSYNHWADVTSIVKPTIDSAPPGRIDLTVTEYNTSAIDGEILAVIFDDPNQTAESTVVLLFGAQDIAGDTFAIGLAEPIDLTDPDLRVDMSLGISFGHQGGNQYSEVDVNGIRMTSWAGGEDDGNDQNGALITVGGLDDSNANPPDPFAQPADDFRYDDELYDLKPFVETGDTNIIVDTINPSNDDNIYFAALNLSTAAVVGEGITLTPISDSKPVGSDHTVTGTVQDDLGNPIEGTLVTFEILSGPHAGLTDTDTTDSNGQAIFTYTGTSPGIDVLQASFVDSQGNTQTSNEVTCEWISDEELGAIAGCVTDCETQVNPIDGAFVGIIWRPMADGDASITCKIWTHTDEKGCYEISDLEPGVYWLISITKGYRLHIAKLEVKAGETTWHDFCLELR